MERLRRQRLPPPLRPQPIMQPYRDDRAKVDVNAALGGWVGVSVSIRYSMAPTDVASMRDFGRHDMVALPVRYVRGSGVFGDNVGIRWKIVTAKDSRPRRVARPSQRWFAVHIRNRRPGGGSSSHLGQRSSARAAVARSVTISRAKPGELRLVTAAALVTRDPPRGHSNLTSHGPCYPGTRRSTQEPT